MPKVAEGPGWSEYELPAFRFTRTLGEKDIGFVIERAVMNFLIEHAPKYRRKDITDIVVNVEPARAGIVQYKVVVAYTQVEREQV